MQFWGPALVTVLEKSGNGFNGIMTWRTLGLAYAPKIRSVYYYNYLHRLATFYLETDKWLFLEKLTVITFEPSATSMKDWVFLVVVQEDFFGILSLVTTRLEFKNTVSAIPVSRICKCSLNSTRFEKITDVALENVLGKRVMSQCFQD